METKSENKTPFIIIPQNIKYFTIKLTYTRSVCHMLYSVDKKTSKKIEINKQTYTVFMYWKSQPSKDVSSPQNNLKI